jgi:hypothetical protein
MSDPHTADGTRVYGTTEVPDMSDQVTDKLLAVQGHGPWETHRQPDAVRAAALANAVDLVKELHPIILTPETAFEDLAQAAGIALATAKEFETYLTGEEAHGES